MKVTPWTNTELKILRDARDRGMTAKGISSLVLKHRTPSAINHTMRRNGISFRDDDNSLRTVQVSISGNVYEHLKSLATEQGVTVARVCRGILQNAAKEA